MLYIVLLGQKVSAWTNTKLLRVLQREAAGCVSYNGGAWIPLGI